MDIEYKPREKESTIDTFVYSRYIIEHIEPHYSYKHIIISITSAPDDGAKLPECTDTVGVLRLSFGDVDSGDTAMTDKQAERIASFIMETQKATPFARVLVHCDAGYSRSPAIAAAISKHFNGDDSQYFGGRYKPNMFVYRKVLNSLENTK
jgi:predicted protein tyrosine phosphatase